MTKEERHAVILQIFFASGYTFELLESLPDDELKKIHSERVKEG